MENLEAKILLKNLLKRIRKIDEDAYELAGYLTDDEKLALEIVFKGFSDSLPTDMPQPASTKQEQSVLEENYSQEIDSQKLNDYIDSTVLEMDRPPEDRRICIDFGTAMSKVSLIVDESDNQTYEHIEVLKLGQPGDQEEVSESMLISSVFIDEAGLLWFGQQAVNNSQRTKQRKRLDNIKHFLSVEGDGPNSEVTKLFNPTNIMVTYGDMILAYLMFLTWTINYCLKKSGEARNLNRRFAILRWS